MPSLDDFAHQKLAHLEQAHLRRTLVPTARLDELYVDRDGRKLLSFSCNDYLDLAQHPALKAAAIAAIERYGVGAGASRLVTGDHPLYAETVREHAEGGGEECLVQRHLNLSPVGQGPKKPVGVRLGRCGQGQGKSSKLGLASAAAVGGHDDSFADLKLDMHDLRL